MLEEQSVDLAYYNGDSTKSLTPLYLAARHGHLELLKFLIEKECSHTQILEPEKGTSMNLLHMASLFGHADVARYLIEEKQFNPMSETYNNKTPLHCACQTGSLNLVKYLVNEKSLDPLHDLNITTPFHFACLFGQLEIVKFLIEEKGCDPMYNTGKYITPYASACTGGKYSDIIYTKYSTETTGAFSKGQLNVVMYLTEVKQCDPLYKDASGTSALGYAAASGAIDILKYFIEERGCNLKVSGDYDEILSIGVQSGNFETVRYLSSIVTSNTGKLCYHVVIVVTHRNYIT